VHHDATGYAGESRQEPPSGGVPHGQGHKASRLPPAGVQYRIGQHWGAGEAGR
jgi:hypothetical protein